VLPCSCVLSGLCSRRTQECPLSENVRSFSGRGTYRTENSISVFVVTMESRMWLSYSFTPREFLRCILYIVVKLMAYLLPRHLLCYCRTLVAQHRLRSTTIVLVNSVARARYSLFPVESPMHCCFLCRRYAKDAWQCYFTLHLTRSPVFVLCMSKL